MTVQYQINGDVFSEITTSWLCVHTRDFLIKARQFDTDQSGNVIEHVQLNDGRVFTRTASAPLAVNIPEDTLPRLQNTQPALRKHSSAHS